MKNHNPEPEYPSRAESIAEARASYGAYARDPHARANPLLVRPTAQESGWKERNLRSMAARDPEAHYRMVRLAQLDKILAATLPGSPEHERARVAAVELRPLVRGY